LTTQNNKNGKQTFSDFAKLKGQGTKLQFETIPTLLPPLCSIISMLQSY